VVNTVRIWLDLAHKRLNEAVFAAYGWKSDLSDGHPSGMLRKDSGEVTGVAPFATRRECCAKFGEKQNREINAL
jgi:hypothetical protein